MTRSISIACGFAFLLLITGCLSKKISPVANFSCCIERFEFVASGDSIEPDHFSLVFSLCDSLLLEEVESVAFSAIDDRVDPLKADIGNWRISDTSNTVAEMIVFTHAFKQTADIDQIEAQLLKHVALILSNQDTVYVGKCPNFSSIR